jgi:hypothetical protein
MAYTIYKQSAFSKGENEEGWDYQSAMDLLVAVLAVASGRLYMGEGSIIYESRHNRTA